MKKNIISLAVATSVAALSTGAVQAQMFLNPEKTGQVLLFPFYDAENGNATNFHVVNTTEDAKAVKIRFREYKASREVLDFNLYLSAEDHFAFGVIMDPNGEGGAIITNDNSCTVPALGSPNNGFDGTTTENADGSVTRIQPFVNFEFIKQDAVYGDYVDSDISRTVRGHVEVIEMGVVNNPAIATKDNGLLHKTFLTHGADGVPANCAGLEASWASTPNGWGSNNGTGLGITAPTGGLYGIAYHINVEDAAAWGFEPAAIAGWRTTQIHRDPGSDQPNLAQGVSSAIVPDGANQGFITFNQIGTRPDIDPVSALFMTQSVTNDVMLNSAIGGATDWVTTFPTKYDYVNDLAAAIPPFTDIYDGVDENSAGTALVELRACEPLIPTYLDREEATTVAGNNFSPKPPGAAGIAVCDETNVTAWGTGTDSALNVERDLFNLSFPYVEGWARWSFLDDDHVLPAQGDVSLLGLPAMGFGAYAYANGSMGGVLMNYGHAAEHKTDVVCSGASCPTRAAD